MHIYGILIAFLLFAGIASADTEYSTINFNGGTDEIDIEPDSSTLDWPEGTTYMDTNDPELGYGYGPEDWYFASANGNPVTIQMRDAYSSGIPFGVQGWSPDGTYEITLSDTFQTMWTGVANTADRIDTAYATVEGATGSLTIEAYAF